MQKPLAIYTKLLLATAIMLLAQACSFNPPLQENGEVALQGVWQQDTAALDHNLVNYSVYKFTLDCDSFLVQMNSYSKVNYRADTCMKNGKWVEYSKGTYHLSHDTLTLKGQFCNANRGIKKEGGCFRYGNYLEDFKIKKNADSVYQYLNLSAINPFKVRLVKNITCTPKAL